ncbi:hypothetical protein ElyMa_005930200 [Elysia marginata]|uniref:PiggyBac transposable element-derived protein domain-containing protein n=1 Tax=Elysia marginata TaxID=1093978 RepID=A0AAV4G8K1_9GAST|nr:hypothetical protein ElyMa_005930200 [Elysia marginata]
MERDNFEPLEEGLALDGYEDDDCASLEECLMSDESCCPCENESGDGLEFDSDQEEAEVSTEEQPERAGIVGTSSDGMVWYKNPPLRTKTSAKHFQMPVNKIPHTNHAKTAADTFRLFITKEMVEDIVRYTNKEDKCQKGTLWMDTDVTEVEGLLGIFL